MRIGLDLTHCYGRHGGIQRYAIELTRALLETAGSDEYVIFVARQPPRELLPYTRNFRVCRFDGPILAEQAWLPFAARQAHLDVLHVTGFAGPVAYLGCVVSSVMDATPFLYPETMRRDQYIYWRHIQPTVARRAQCVVTISEAAATDIAKYLKIDRAQIVVTHLASAPAVPELLQKELAELVVAKWRLPRPFILAASTLEPRKNLGRLLEAYGKLLHTCDEGGAPDLVLAGNHGWLYDDVVQAAGSTLLRGCVHLLGDVSDDELIGLYCAALFLAYPSLYEGFGLPPLEAMTYRCPVLASTTPALVEVLQDSALLVEATDVSEIHHGLQRLSMDAELRIKLQDLGQKRSAAYSWTRTAQKTREAYELAVG